MLLRVNARTTRDDREIINQIIALYVSTTSCCLYQCLMWTDDLMAVTMDAGSAGFSVASCREMIIKYVVEKIFAPHHTKSCHIKLNMQRHFGLLFVTE